MRGCLLCVAAVSGAITLTVHAQAPAPATAESLVNAAKRAAGVDYAGTFLRYFVGTRIHSSWARRCSRAVTAQRS
jgi:hypothetical protein